MENPLSKIGFRPCRPAPLPESIAHIAEALWMQALDEGKRRAAMEQRDSARLAELDKQRLELRSHVLTLREGELDSRLRDRDRTIKDLNVRLRELTGVLREEQATRELLTRETTAPKSARRRKRKPRRATGAKPRPSKGTGVARPKTRAKAAKKSRRR